MSRNKSFVGELFSFVLRKKKWWLLPVIIMILFVSVLIIFAQSSAISPFLYALF